LSLRPAEHSRLAFIGYDRSTTGVDVISDFCACGMYRKKLMFVAVKQWLL